MPVPLPEADPPYGNGAQRLAAATADEINWEKSYRRLHRVDRLDGGSAGGAQWGQRRFFPTAYPLTAELLVINSPLGQEK